MTVAALLLALQAAPAEPPTRFSILLPTPNEHCTPRPPERAAEQDTIVVCGDPLPSQTVPYADEIAPTRPMPVNPNISGAGALAAANTPCVARPMSCTGPGGLNLVPALVGTAKLIGGTFKKKPDKTGRVAIPLDDPAPAHAQP